MSNKSSSPILFILYYIVGFAEYRDFFKPYPKGKVVLPSDSLCRVAGEGIGKINKSDNFLDRFANAILKIFTWWDPYFDPSTTVPLAVMGKADLFIKHNRPEEYNKNLLRIGLRNIFYSFLYLPMLAFYFVGVIRNFHKVITLTKEGGGESIFLQILTVLGLPFVFIVLSFVGLFFNLIQALIRSPVQIGEAIFGIG